MQVPTRDPTNLPIPTAAPTAVTLAVVGKNAHAATPPAKVKSNTTPLLTAA